MTAAAAPADAAQLLGERFAQLYYGLLAVKPSALRQFYTEESQMSRIWCGPPCAPDALPHQGSEVCRGVAQIADTIMSSVGGQDGTDEEPVVVTNVESVQSCALGNLSGIMTHITGLITFVAEGKIRRFSQSVLLEPCPKGRSALCVRSDIVHYDDVHATQRTPLAFSSANAELQEVSAGHPSESSQSGTGNAGLAGSGTEDWLQDKASSPAMPSTPAGVGGNGVSAASPSSGGSVSWASIAAASSARAKAGPSQPAGTVQRRQPSSGYGNKAPPEVSATPSASSAPSGDAPTASASSAATGGSAASPDRAPVKLWVSGIPTEDTKGKELRFNPVRATEVRDELNKSLREHAPHMTGEVLEVDRKDDRKPFAFVLVGDEKTARELVILSKAKKVTLRGEKLVLDLSNYNTARVENLYSAGSAPASRGGSWRDDSDRGWSNSRGKGGKRDEWPSRERGRGRGGASRESRDDNWRQR